MAKRTKRRADNDAGTARWNRRIGFICTYAAKNRGFMTAVADRINAVHRGMAVKPQQVREWLVADAAERVEPRAGMAELLVEACEHVMQRGKDGEAEPAVKAVGMKQPNPA